jgi:uncharacterized protein YggE
MQRLILFLAPALLLAQFSPQQKYVRAFGEGVVTVRPDLAKVNVSVVTQASTAQEAAAENATRTAAVIERVTAAVRGAQIRTVNYSVTPNYRSPGSGQPAVLVDFTATNTLEVTTTDITAIGLIIDTAIAAGANRVDGLRLTLQDEEPAKAQALRMAGQKARARVEAIATGLGVRLGQVLAAEEGFTYRVTPVDRSLATTATPVQPGTLEVHATVTLEVEILQ